MIAHKVGQQILREFLNIGFPGRRTLFNIRISIIKELNTLRIMEGLHPDAIIELAVIHNKLKQVRINKSS